MNNTDYTLPRLIRDSMQLDSEKFPPGKGGKWNWSEQNALSKKAKLSLVERDSFSRSVAFSLDMIDPANLQKRFAFFPKDCKDLRKVAETHDIQGELKLLSDIAAICDIIVLSQKADALCAFVIEAKSANTGNNQANTQITNGVFFCEWLHRLLNKHCGIPARLEIVRITRLAKREKKKRKSKQARGNPEPLENKTLKYGSDYQIIYLQDAYECCKIFECLEVRDISAL